MLTTQRCPLMSNDSLPTQKRKRSFILLVREIRNTKFEEPIVANEFLKKRRRVLHSLDRLVCSPPLAYSTVYANNPLARCRPVFERYFVEAIAHRHVPLGDQIVRKVSKVNVKLRASFCLSGGGSLAGSSCSLYKALEFAPWWSQLGKVPNLLLAIVFNYLLLFFLRQSNMDALDLRHLRFENSIPIFLLGANVFRSKKRQNRNMNRARVRKL